MGFSEWSRSMNRKMVKCWKHLPNHYSFFRLDPPTLNASQNPCWMRLWRLEVSRNDWLKHHSRQELVQQMRDRLIEVSRADALLDVLTGEIGHKLHQSWLRRLVMHCFTFNSTNSGQCIRLLWEGKSFDAKECQWLTGRPRGGKKGARIIWPTVLEYQLLSRFPVHHASRRTYMFVVHCPEDTC